MAILLSVILFFITICINVMIMRVEYKRTTVGIIKTVYYCFQFFFDFKKKKARGVSYNESIKNEYIYKTYLSKNWSIMRLRCYFK